MNKNTDDLIGHVATTIDYCRNFPSQPNPWLPREQQYELLNKTLKSHRIVMLTGEPLSGKTECLADIMRKFPNACIGIFLNPDLGILNSPSYLRQVIAEQISWIVDGVDLSDSLVSEERYLHLICKLQRYAKNTRITWLLDGLSPERISSGRDSSELVEMIPFGMREFDFVISGETSLVTQLKLTSQKITDLFIVPVGVEEAKTYFSDLEVSEQDIKEIRSFCSGSIGRMQKFREFLAAGISFDSLLVQHSPSLESLFEFEWNLLPQSEQMRKTLAYVVFSSKPVFLIDISRFLELSIEETMAVIQHCRILCWPNLNSNEPISIESRAQREFVKRRLGEYERSVRSHVITDLLNSPNSKDTILYLPSQLMDAGRHEDLLTHLGPSHFLNLLDTERSLFSIRRHAEFGIKAAKASNKHAAELAYSIIRSTATGLAFSVGSEYQIETLVRLGSTEGAIELASMAITKEERLHLLAVAANALHANEKPIPSALKEQIELLEKDISFEAIGELGIEIACNLLPIDFARAMEITSRVLSSAKKKVAQAEMDEGSANRLAPLGERSSVTSQAMRPGFDYLPEHWARKVSEAVSATVEKFSSERIQAFIKHLDSSNKITVLAGWLGRNKKHLNALSIAEQALEIVLTSISRTPKLKDLREIAEILPYVKDEAACNSLAKRIEAQLAIMGQCGTSEEFVRLKLLLSRVHISVDRNQTELLLIDLFSDIESITDIGVKATCWTWMLYGLTSFENSTQLEADTSLITEVATSLDSTIDSLLANTANHHQAAGAAISALAQTNPQQAFDLVGRLNTEQSRDKGYEELARSIVFSSVKESALPVLSKALRAIRDDAIRNSAILKSLRMLVRFVEIKAIPSVIPTLGDMWECIRLSSFRLQALAVIYHLRLHEDRDSVNGREMAEHLESVWDQVPVDSVKIELGYLIAHELAVDEPELARDWIRKSAEYAKTRKIPSDSVLDALQTTVALSVRTYPYLHDAEDTNFNRLVSLVQSLPSFEYQLHLWTILGIKLYYSDQFSRAQTIVEEYIEPILSRDFDGNELARDSLVAFVAPLLYLIHPASATQSINRISCPQFKDLARTNVCDVLLRRLPHTEPYEAPEEQPYRIDAKVVADLLAIFINVKFDYNIFQITRDLCLSLADDSNRTHITRTAALDNLSSIKEIVENSLPDKTNIQHNGYLIVCRAYVLAAQCKIKNARSAADKSQWKEIYGQARSVDNVADRVIVTAYVGSSAIDCDFRTEISDIENDLKNDLACIPSSQDRVDRYDWVAKILRPVDKKVCTTIVSEAIRYASNLPETPDLVKRQRSLIDIAYNIDPTLADQIIEMGDVDEARRESLKKTNARQNNRVEFSKNPSGENISNMTDQEIVDFCRSDLGRLNAGRISVKSLEDFSGLKRRASVMPMNIASGIWHLIVESSLRKRKNDRDGEFAFGLFDCSCKAAEIVCGLIGKFFSGEQHNYKLDIGIIRSGDRDLFLEAVRNWAVGSDHGLIHITDPYFGPEDMELIKLIKSNSPKSSFRVLTSKEHIRKKKIVDAGEAFEETWRQISDEPIPKIEIAVIGIGSSGKHPIHDRWIVSDISGLCLGTSAHSMGGTRTSEVSHMQGSEISIKRDEIDRFFVAPPREWNGERLAVTTYRL